MKQRVAIAISIALRPQLLIADEPTSALDVITQRRVMQTLREVQDAIGAGLILIGHDMGLMAQFVDRIMVLRHGRLVEAGEVRQIFRAPKAYTKELTRACRRSSALRAGGRAQGRPRPPSSSSTGRPRPTAADSSTERAFRRSNP